MTLPPFTEDGLLPPDTYVMTFPDLTASHLVTGGDSSTPADWDVNWRQRLVGNAEILVKQLKQVGISEVFLDGSFVEAKPLPNDIDGYFECDPIVFGSGQIERQLNALDPHKIWTWSPTSRRVAINSMKRQLPMWHRYRVELYPHFPNLLSGIRDQFGNELSFPSAFRQQRGTGLPKGIIKVVV